ncbi:MAG: type II secretion system F family protein [Ignisphaera sp.]
MRKEPRVIVLSVIVMLLGLILPLIVLPLITKLIGFNFFRGIRGLYIKVRFYYIPIPVLLSPDSYTTIGCIISFTMLSIYLLFKEDIETRRRLGRQTQDFITVLSSYVRAGVPMSKAVELSSNAVGKPLQDYLIRFAKLIQLGFDPFKAFETVFGDVPREVKAVLSCLPVGFVSGGRVAEVLSIAERFSFQLSRLNELRRTRLEGYKALLYLTIFAYVMGSIITIVLLSYIAKAAFSTPFARASIDIYYTLSLYYISTIFIAVISSIAISRMIYGEIVPFLKYSAIAILASSLIFSLVYAFI